MRAYLNTKDLTNTEYIENNYIILCTKKGIIKKTNLKAYSRPRQNGIIAINIRENDELLQAKLTNGSNEIIMGLLSGRAIRFNETKVRPMGRNASGVKGVTLSNQNDEVIGMICLESYNSRYISSFGTWLRRRALGRLTNIVLQIEVEKE